MTSAPGEYGATSAGEALGPGDLAALLCRALVDEWARAGVANAVVSPGSRSTPLALALWSDGRVDLDVVLDERSAGFFALGAAKASGRPVVVLCTSGTAAANYHPAVLEAFHAGVPLIVCTADRPPQLRDTGAGQTIDQVKLFAGTVVWSFDLPVPAAGRSSAELFRLCGARSVIEATRRPRGPVHLNLAFDDELVPSGTLLGDVPGRSDGEPWIAPLSSIARASETDLSKLAELVGSTERGLVVAGWGSDTSPRSLEAFSRVSAWPVLADAVSGLREGPVVSSYEALLRDGRFSSTHRPDAVLQLGAALTSKVATAFVDSVPRRVLVSPDGRFLDPHRSASAHLSAEADELLQSLAERVAPRRDSAWAASWKRADEVARGAIDRLFSSYHEPFEGRIARDVFAGVADGTSFYVASSMPVRDLEYFAEARGGVRVLANRGVNGIDGFVSSALGAARTSGRVVALAGDLCFLHDAGGLLGAKARGLDVVFVVVDNNGGGIFSFLEQSGLERTRFEELFGTPHGIELERLVRVHDLGFRRIDKSDDLVPALSSAQSEGGVQVLVVRTEREANVRSHRDVWEAVSAELANLALGPA